MPTGLLIRGNIISSTAQLIAKKDGSGWLVQIQHELALVPEVAIWKLFIGPAEDDCVDVAGGTMKKFSLLPMLTNILLKVRRFWELNGQLYVSNAVPIG